MNRTTHSYPSRVFIREVGAREGFQNFHRVVPTAEKLRVLSALVTTGISSFEVAACVRPDRVPQMADAEQIVQGLKGREGVEFTVLYLNLKGFERARFLPNITMRGWIPISVSETFLKRNNNLSHQELFHSFSMWEKAFVEAKVPFYGLMVSTAFGCNDEGEVSPEKLSTFLHEVARHLASSPQEVCLADTMGWGTPDQVQESIKVSREIFPQAEVSLHLHDTRGMGIANAFAGLSVGVSVFESSLGGVGGCPFAPGATGNIATEELVYLCHSLGIETGVSLEECVKAVEVLEEVMGEVPSRYYRMSKKKALC